MKFVIVSDRQKWGGMIVLHRIAEILNELGYDARIFYTDIGRPLGISRFPMTICKMISSINWGLYTIKDIIFDIFTKLIGENNTAKYFSTLYNGYCYKPVEIKKRKYLPFINKDTIVIYPDIIWGNPLRAEKIVRYYMYYNRFPDDENATQPNDLIYCYRKIFNDYKLNPKCNMMQVSYFDLKLYKKTNYGERKGNCYIIRKGEKRDDLPQNFDGVIIDDLTEPQKVEVFNRCEMCICYDTQTAYSSIAAMCGCLSVIIPEKGKTRDDYLTAGERKPGVAYGFDPKEIEYAKKTVHEIYDIYDKSNRCAVEEVKRFVSMCSNYFQ